MYSFKSTEQQLCHTLAKRENLTTVIAETLCNDKDFSGYFGISGGFYLTVLLLS